MTKVDGLIILLMVVVSSVRLACNTQIYDIRRIVSKNTMAENQWVDVIHSVLLLVQSDLPIYSFFFPKLV